VTSPVRGPVLYHVTDEVAQLFTPLGRTQTLYNLGPSTAFLSTSQQFDIEAGIPLPAGGSLLWDDDAPCWAKGFPVEATDKGVVQTTVRAVDNAGIIDNPDATSSFIADAIANTPQYPPPSFLAVIEGHATAAGNPVVAYDTYIDGFFVAPPYVVPDDHQLVIKTIVITGSKAAAGAGVARLQVGLVASPGVLARPALRFAGVESRELAIPYAAGFYLGGGLDSTLEIKDVSGAAGMTVDLQLIGGIYPGSNILP
jgi:hypothetical protein